MPWRSRAWGRLVRGSGTLLLLVLVPGGGLAQAPPAADSSSMLMFRFGGGFRISGLAQAFPIYSVGRGGFEDLPLGEGEFYLTQVLGMVNLNSPQERWALRLTPNLEGLTIQDGELTLGGWGEGFIDRRHPHSLIHEAVLSLNLWDSGLSFSLGKGFAPYGTPDPMSRPGVKFPTNHHLSQVLERFFVSGAWTAGGWALEAGVFGGTEPNGPYDFGNVSSFGDSWSIRLSHAGAGVELRGSYGAILEPPEPQLDLPGLPANDVHPRTRSHLFSAAVLRASPSPGRATEWMVEASMDRHLGQTTFWAVLAEAKLPVGAHRPYLRLEYASRPEFARFGGPGTQDFFRYGFEDDAIGGNRWLLATMGYARALPWGRLGVHPFIEVQGARIREGWGGFRPDDVLGASAGFVVTTGFRLYLGGEPMRMGAYGVLNPMTRPRQP